MMVEKYIQNYVIIFIKNNIIILILSEKRVIQKFIIEENLQELINQDPYFDYSINNNYILRETSNPNFLTVLSCTNSFTEYGLFSTKGQPDDRLGTLFVI